MNKFDLVTNLEDPLSELNLTDGELVAARRDWIRSELYKHGRKEPLRILISTNTLVDGGAEHQVVRLMPRLVELGINVEHMYYHRPDVLLARIKAKQLVSHFIDKAELGQIKFMVKAVSLMRKCKYDVIHAFMACTNIYVRAAAILAHRSVIIAGCRNRTMESTWKFNWAVSILNLFSSAWIINSATNIEALQNFRFMKGKNIFVLPNALELDLEKDTKPAPIDPKLRQWVADRKIIAAVGRISPQKNFDMFLDVAKEVNAVNKDVCFCIVGRAQFQEIEDKLRIRIEKEQMSDYVRLLGASRDVAGFLPNISILLCTSDWEGCPNVVIEAMRAKLPVIMTRCTDTKKLIKHGQSGYIVNKGDAAAMSDHVIELLNEREKREKFGQCARKMVEKDFSAPNSAWLLARIYLNEWCSKNSALE